MQWQSGLAVIGVLAMTACTDAGYYPGPQTRPPVAAPPAVQSDPAQPASVRPPEALRGSFSSVVAQVEPMAEALCREVSRAPNCDFRIVIDDRPGQPPNAFQTVDRAGRPVLGFTTALIADARNADELAFVIGHEAAHHIAGHIPQVQQSALTGALLAGAIAQASGLSSAGVQQAQQAGASLAARSFSKEFELEADALGAEIAFHAGYDAVRGSAFFDRLPDPGDKFLGTHPGNAERKAVVRRVIAQLQGS